MALRKEDFDEEEEHQEANTMKRSRITIDISPELRRRIKIAALQNDSSISEYVGDILEKIVPDEANVILEEELLSLPTFWNKSYEYVSGLCGRVKGSFLKTQRK